MTEAANEDNNKAKAKMIKATIQEYADHEGIRLSLDK
jgi:hypothetical protein